MKRPKVLLIGLDPSLIDFSRPGYSPHPGIDAAVIEEALRRDKADLADSGIDLHLCLVDFGATAVSMVQAALEEAHYPCILLGAGLRLNRENTVLFENLINLVRRLAPAARLCFNTKADDSAEAIRRQVDGLPPKGVVRGKPPLLAMHQGVSRFLRSAWLLN